MTSAQTITGPLNRLELRFLARWLQRLPTQVVIDAEKPRATRQSLCLHTLCLHDRRIIRKKIWFAPLRGNRFAAATQVVIPSNGLARIRRTELPLEQFHHALLRLKPGRIEAQGDHVSIAQQDQATRTCQGKGVTCARAYRQAWEQSTAGTQPGRTPGNRIRLARTRCCPLPCSSYQALRTNRLRAAWPLLARAAGPSAY